MSRLLRDVFNENSVKGLAARIRKVCTGFRAEDFRKCSTADFDKMNYAERLEQITMCLHRFLPDDYASALNLLTEAVTGEREYHDNFKFRDDLFINLPLSRYVSMFGLDDFELSMDALKHMTKSFTAEYDIRYFIEKYPEESISLMRKWADDKNVHVRRLASEGTRPRLPMGRRLKMFVENPSPILPILEKLKNDPVLYVRRSVANSLNDISKDHPELAAEIAGRWLDEDFEHSEWVAKHAMRTLYKAGHGKALAMSGYPEPVDLEISEPELESNSLTMGSDLEFSFELYNGSDFEINIMADYEIHFMKSSGKLSPKVFKLKKCIIKPGERVTLSGRYPFRGRTTRKYYPGEHLLFISVNGLKRGPVSFTLTV